MCFSVDEPWKYPSGGVARHNGPPETVYRECPDEAKLATEMESRECFQGLRGEKGGKTAERYMLFWGKSKNILELKSAEGCKNLQIY